MAFSTLLFDKVRSVIKKQSTARVIAIRDRYQSTLIAHVCGKNLKSQLAREIRIQTNFVRSLSHA